MANADIIYGTDPATSKRYPITVDPLTGELIVQIAGSSGSGFPVVLQQKIVTYSITGAQTSGTIIPETSPLSENSTDTRTYGSVQFYVTVQGAGAPSFSFYSSPDNTNWSLAQYTKSGSTALTPFMASMSSTVGSTYTGKVGPYTQLKLTANQSSGTTTIIAVYTGAIDPVVIATGGIGSQNSPTLPNPLLDGGRAGPSLLFVSDAALTAFGTSQYGSIMAIPGVGTNPNQAALYNNSAGTATALVSFLDSNGKQAPMVDTNAVKWGHVTITLTSATAYSLGNLIQASTPDTTHPIVGIPATAVTAIVQWTSTNTGDIRANASGTIDGTVGGGRGIDSTLVAPNATSPQYMLPGGLYPIWSPFQIGDPTGLAVATVSSQDIPAGATWATPYTTGASDITDNSPHTMFAAPGAGIRNWLTFVSVTNNSAVTTKFYVLDGATVIATGLAYANGRGMVLNWGPRALKQPTANTAINIQAVTTGTALQVSANAWTL